jgi:hypothetical protein
VPASLSVVAGWTIELHITILLFTAADKPNNRANALKP